MAPRMITAAVALVTVLAACGGAGPAGGRGGEAGSRGAADASGPSGVANASGSGGTGNAVGASKSTPNPWTTFSRPAIPPLPPGYAEKYFFDVVNISVPEDESWGGETCVPPRAGSKCTILFRGVAFLAKDDKGTVLIQIIEDERPVPKTLYRQSVVKGRNTVYEWVPYEVPAGVHAVITKAVLLNSKGVPLAESPPQRHYIS